MASQSNPTNTLPIAAFFSSLFHSFPRLLLTNFIFALPLAASVALFQLLGYWLQPTGAASVLLSLLAIVTAFPFYAGVVRVTAKLVSGEEDVRVFSVFVKAVKDNFLRFLVHGLVFYAATVLSYFSIALYINLIQKNSLFIGTLIVSLLVVIFFLFMFFYIPTMTVTFDLPMRYLYKNSLLMSYGELKRNFLGLFGLIVLLAVATTCLLACNASAVAVIICTAVLGGALVPSVAAFIINYAVYRQMVVMLTSKEDSARAIDSKIREAESKRQKQEALDDFKERLKSFVIDESLSDDEYIYFEGRMMKKSVLAKLKQEALESEGISHDR